MEALNFNTAFFGGQYYGLLDYHRPSIRIFYGPDSVINFDDTVVYGEDAIVAMFIELGELRHNVMRANSFEPYPGCVFASFLGDCLIAGQWRNFVQNFLLEETIAGRRILFSLFRSFVQLDPPPPDHQPPPPPPPVDPPLPPPPPADPPPPPTSGGLPVPQEHMPVPWAGAQENGPIASPPRWGDLLVPHPLIPEPPALADGMDAPSSGIHNNRNGEDHELSGF